MNRQQIRQAARKQALEGQEVRRRERAAQDKRLEGLAIDVLVAVAERDAAIQEAEHKAGAAVRSMLEAGISVSAVAQCCGGTVSAREVRRLARTVDDAKNPQGESSGVPSENHDETSQEPRAG